MNEDILQKIYSNELETYAFIRNMIENFETGKNREEICRWIWYERSNFKIIKEQSGNTLALIRELLCEGLT